MQTAFSARYRNPQTGLTFVELILTMLIISVAVLGMTRALGFAFAHQSDGLWQVKAAALAEAYLEEIRARRYAESTPNGGVPPCTPASCGALGPEGGETRDAFDDVDDYHGLDELPPLDADGNVRAGYEGYRVAVQVRYVSDAERAALGLDDVTDAKLVGLRVTAPGQGTLPFLLYRANY